MNGVIAHELTIFDRLNLPPVSGQVSHFNMIGIKPRPLELLRDVEEIGEKGELNRDTVLTQIWYAIQTIDALAQGAIERLQTSGLPWLSGFWVVHPPTRLGHCFT